MDNNIKNKNEFEDFFKTLETRKSRLKINSYDAWLIEMRELMMIRMCLVELCLSVNGKNPIEKIEHIYNDFLNR